MGSARPLLPYLMTVGSSAVLFARLAQVYAHRYALPGRAAAGIYICFMLLLSAALAPGFGGIRAQLAGIKTTPVLGALGCLPYAIYSAGTQDFRWTALAKLLAIGVGVPTAYGAFRVKDESRFHWQDACVAMALIGVALSGQLRGIWNLPVNLDFMGRLFLVAVASWCWIFVRPVPQLGYEFHLSAAVLRAAALNFAYFAAIAIPLGLGLHFTAWNPRWPGLDQFCLDFLEIFLFIALLEELFFRGFLQTLLSRTLGSWIAGQGAVSILFGFFHILHRPFPNWRYVALASVAGWFYGSAFRQGGNLMASALMHAAVDTVWRTWLTAGSG